MRVATADEAKFATDHTLQYKTLPWAAGRPGGLFDKPEDVLFSDFSDMAEETKQFLKHNDITGGNYHSRTPYADDSQMQSLVQCSGFHYQTQQIAPQIIFHEGSNNQDVMRVMDLLEPLLVPLVVEINDYSSQRQVLVGQYWQSRTRDLNASGIPALFKTGDQWLVLFTSYHHTAIVHTARDRADALRYCMDHYAMRKESEEQEDYDDTY